MFKAELRAAEVYPIFQKKRSSVTKKSHSQNFRNWALKLKSLLPIDYERKWFKFGNSNSKIVGVRFFVTPHNFANGPHLVALTRVRATKTGSEIFAYFWNFRNPEWVRICWVHASKKFSVENFRVRSDLQKSSVFHWFLCPQTKKKVSGSCTHNFDATDLPNS